MARRKSRLPLHRRGRRQMAIAIDLDQIAKRARRNSERWFPQLHADQDMTTFYSLALAGEMGEVANLAKKRMRRASGVVEFESQIADELADIFTYLLLLADECNVNLVDAFEKKQAICE